MEKSSAVKKSLSCVKTCSAALTKTIVVIAPMNRKLNNHGIVVEQSFADFEVSVRNLSSELMTFPYRSHFPEQRLRRASSNSVLHRWAEVRSASRCRNSHRWGRHRVGGAQKVRWICITLSIQPAEPLLTNLLNSSCEIVLIIVIDACRWWSAETKKSHFLSSYSLCGYYRTYLTIGPPQS